VGIDASGVDNGSFFIGDRDNFVSGDSAKRLVIDNSGKFTSPSDNVGNIGITGRSWASVKDHIMPPGDLVFENGYRVTEDRKSGLLFLNQRSEQIGKLDEEANFRIKGKFIEEP
jgi:hypothetical protein